MQIVQGDTVKMLALKHGENSHRREQNPMARARAAYDLAQQMPEEKAAVVMGLGLAQFRNVIKLLDLAPAVAKEVTKGTISASAATPLTSLLGSRADRQAHGAGGCRRLEADDP